MSSSGDLTYPNVDVFLGRGFEELEAERVCELFAPLEGDHSLVLHVAFVPD